MSSKLSTPRACFRGGNRTDLLSTDYKYISMNPDEPNRDDIVEIISNDYVQPEGHWHRIRSYSEYDLAAIFAAVACKRSSRQSRKQIATDYFRYQSMNSFNKHLSRIVRYTVPGQVATAGTRDTSALRQRKPRSQTLPLMPVAVSHEISPETINHLLDERNLRGLVLFCRFVPSFVHAEIRYRKYEFLRSLRYLLAQRTLWPSPDLWRYLVEAFHSEDDPGVATKLFHVLSWNSAFHQDLKDFAETYARRYSVQTSRPMKTPTNSPPDIPLILPLECSMPVSKLTLALQTSLGRR